MKRYFCFLLSFVILSSMIISFSGISLAQEEPAVTKKKSERVEDEDKKKDKEKKGELERFREDHDDEEEEEDIETDCGWWCFWGDIFVDVFVEVLKFTFAKDPHDSTRFLSYPYLDGEYGLAMRNTSYYRSGFGQMKAYYQRVSSNVDAAGFSLRGRFHSRAGLSIDYTRYFEQLSNNETDYLNLFRLGFIKSIIINEVVVFDMDLGLRIIDEYGGADVGLRSQIFPGNPFVLDLWGSLGGVGDNFFGELNFSVGLLINRFQIDVGYRMLYWGDEDLGGGYGGLRVWF